MLGSQASYIESGVPCGRSEDERPWEPPSRLPTRWRKSSYRRAFLLLDNYLPWSRVLNARGSCYSSFLYSRSRFLSGSHPGGLVLEIIN